SSDTVEAKTPARTRPGWAPRPNRQVKLVHGWDVPERGAGQDEEDATSSPTPASPDIEELLGRTGGWAADAYRQAQQTPQSLTDDQSAATTSPGPDASTQVPTTPAPTRAPATSVLPSRPKASVSAPEARPQIAIGASAPPPQGSRAAPSLGSSQQ